MRMQLNNFTAWISIDGVEQPQHAIEYSIDGMVAMCWMASEVGKNFSVSWRDLVSSLPSSGRVLVDGQDGGSTVMHRPEKGRGLGSHTVSRTGFRTSSTTRRPYMFSKLELTDDDKYLHTAVSPDLGEIKLEIYRCSFVTITSVARRDGFKPVTTGPDKIHERSKKAMGHRATFGPEVPCAARSSRLNKSKKLGKIATFVFKYRPLAVLQANGIVPCHKGRKRVASADDALDPTPHDVDDDELEAQRIKVLKEELASLERKRDQRRKRVKIEVKTEVKGEPKHGQKNGGLLQLGEVIDLT